MTQVIQQTEWKEFFDRLSREMSNWQTTVQVLNDAAGAQVLSEGLPFAGLTFEERKDDRALELTVGSGPQNHQMHNIYEPVKVAFEPRGAKAGTLDILDASGTSTLITFVKPMPTLTERPVDESIAAP